MDAQSQSEHPIGKGISRRTLAQVLAAGAVAATAGTLAFAQQTSSMSEASPQDYVRDPTRWGSPEVAALFPGFKHLDMRTKGAVIRVRHGGSGPPLLLLHGYPNNHVLWHAVGAKLAQRYHVVCPDLRGYGDSSLPDPGARLINYSHRVMAEDNQRRLPRLSRGRDHQFRDGRGRQRQKDRDSAPRFVGYKRRTADGRISNGMAEIRQQSGEHRAACHRTLHTRGTARAVSRSFLQILCSLVKRRAPATNGRRLFTSSGRPSRSYCYADATALFCNKL